MDPDASQQSLAARLTAAARARLRERGQRPPRDAEPAGARDWWLEAALAALIALGPLATIVGANLLAANARSEARAFEAKAAPRLAAERAVARDRTALTAIVERPALGAVLEAVARALPAEASLARAERTAEGMLEIEVRTTDPDRVREALRREPGLAMLRDSGQRQGEGAMLVTFREVAP